MSQSVTARPLEKAEEEKFRKGATGRKTAALGPMAIMGKADDLYIIHLKTEPRSYKQYVGDGDYYDESSPLLRATGGKTVPALWGIDTALNYVKGQASDLGIPIFEEYDLTYFQSIHINVMLEAFSYADRALHDWYKKSYRWYFFGPVYPAHDSVEFKNIIEGVRSILAKSMRK